VLAELSPGSKLYCEKKKTNFRGLWSRVWVGEGVWVLPFGVQAAPCKTKQTTATVTANTRKETQTRPLLLNFPCDNTRQPVCLKNILVLLPCRASASGRGIAALRRKPMQSPGLLRASPSHKRVLRLPSSPLFLQARRNQAALIQHCPKHRCLSLCRKGDFSHAHPHCVREDVRALLRCKVQP